MSDCGNCGVSAAQVADIAAAEAKKCVAELGLGPDTDTFATATEIPAAGPPAGALTDGAIISVPGGPDVCVPPKSTPERSDGSALATGPNGGPCVSPDQNWCNPATGAVEPIPKGQTVQTEENAPYCISGGTFFFKQNVDPNDVPGENALLPVVSEVVVNPDLCRDMVKHTTHMDWAEIESTSGPSSAGDWGAVSLATSQDMGDGTLYLMSGGNKNSLIFPSDWTDSDGLATGFSNSDFETRPWGMYVPFYGPEVTIPAGGSVTLQASGELVDSTTGAAHYPTQDPTATQMKIGLFYGFSYEGDSACQIL